MAKVVVEFDLDNKIDVIRFQRLALPTDNKYAEVLIRLDQRLRDMIEAADRLPKRQMLETVRATLMEDIAQVAVLGDLTKEE